MQSKKGQKEEIKKGLDALQRDKENYPLPLQLAIEDIAVHVNAYLTLNPMTELHKYPEIISKIKPALQQYNSQLSKHLPLKQFLHNLIKLIKGCIIGSLVKMARTRKDRGRFFYQLPKKQVKTTLNDIQEKFNELEQLLPSTISERESAEMQGFEIESPQIVQAT